MQEISERLLLAASNTIDTHGFAPGAGTEPSHPRRADTSPAPDFTHSPLSHGHVWWMVCFSRPPPLMSPSPSLTFKVSFVVYVVSTIAAITTQVPLAVWQFLPKFLSLSHFFKALRSKLQCSSKTFQMVTGFKQACASH